MTYCRVRARVEGVLANISRATLVAPAIAVFLIALIVPVYAFGQGTQPTAETPPKVQEIRAVERGLFLETDIGAAYLVTKIDGRSYGLAIVTGAYVGFDILPILSISFGGSMVAASVSDSASTPVPRGDLVFVMPMAQLQLALLSTERNLFFVRGAGGFSIGLPSEIDGTPYGGNGPSFSGTIGFERYTKLRHFSIGVLAGVIVVTKPDVGIGVSILPTLKYTF